MPFSQHNIDPQHIEALRAAFRRVCDILQLNCEADDPMTEIVVMKIVELAKAGELDPERLCLAVIADLDGAPQASPRASTAMRGPSMTLGPAIQSPSYLLSVKWRLLVYCLQRLYPIAVAKLDRAIQ